jgi:hypothetical protein
MFEVVRAFRDAKNDNHFYKVGDEYPVAGASKPSKARIEELAKGKNKYGKVYIKEVAETSDDNNNTEDTEDTNTGDENSDNE